MLGKLLKNEWKATSRVLVPLHIILILATVFGKLMISTGLLAKPSMHILGSIGLISYILVILALAITTFILLVTRFYRNLFTDEGYLSFTLPVKPQAHIIAKLIPACTWAIIDGGLIFLSIFILAENRTTLKNFAEVFQYMQQDFARTQKMPFELFLLSLGIIAILSLVCAFLQIYASIAIGQLSNKHRILAAVGAYIGINMGLNILFNIGLAILLDNFFAFNWDPDFGLNFTLISITATFLLLSGLFFGVTRYILTKKLNLQ